LDVGEFQRYASQHCQLQFVLVNDGSTDGTRRILDQLQAHDPDRFDAVHLHPNRGKAEAVRQGMLYAMSQGPELVGFWDADLATPLDAIGEFRDLLQQRPQLQMVIGARVRLLGRKIDRCRSRHCLGRAFATVASLLLNLPIYDTQCGAKLFRNTPELQRMLASPFCSKWIFDVELLARMVASRRRDADIPAGEVIYEMPLARWKDVGGSKLRPKDFARALFDLAVIYWTYLRPGAARRTSPVPHLIGSDRIGEVAGVSTSELTVGARTPPPETRDSTTRGKAA
jgi:glycosyltransferase involved in cell wall biosynthesis